MYTACSFWGIKSFESNFTAQFRLKEEAAQRDEIHCCMGYEPDVNLQLQKRHRKVYITSSSAEAPANFHRADPLHFHSHTKPWISGPWLNPNWNSKVSVVFFPFTVALCRCGRRCKFRGIYANVKQNSWSELVIHELSKENESLDTATRTRLVPAFWMTSWLFIPLDFLPLFFSFFIFSFSYLFPPCLFSFFC